jgi:hypothetical protein
MVESTSSLQTGANAIKLVMAIGGPDRKSCTSLKMKGVQISGNSGMFQTETLFHFDRKALGHRLSSYDLAVAAVADELGTLYNTCIIPAVGVLGQCQAAKWSKSYPCSPS